MGSTRYQVYFQPLTDSDSNVYGPEIDVSDRIRMTGVGTIRRSIDASDYDVGVFVFSDLELTGMNYQGYFNEDDYRSIFPAGRDRCRVRVVYQDLTFTRNSEGTILTESVSESNTFRGIINEEATRLDITNDSIRFKVLSRDSVLRTTKISSGVVTNGMTFKAAIEAILNVPRITMSLGFDASRINPKLNLTIDNGSKFNNKSVKEALDKLLFASNSVLLVNDAGEITVKDRTQDETIDPLFLYGKNDQYRRENIIDITTYNTGKQRNFTSFVVNDTEISNADYVEAFGLRQKKITLDFITDPIKEAQIANEMVGEFKSPKAELNVKVSTALAKTVNLLDRVSVNYPHRIKPVDGKFLPVVGITKLGETDQPLPEVYGSLAIEPRVKFKVIEVEDNPEKFTSVLKLRQCGTEVGDGYYDEPQSPILGFAILGIAKITGVGDFDSQWNPSVIGAARLGSTIAG